MDLGLSNKVALVLGAGGGLGGAIANTLAAEGARLAIADRSAEALARTASSLNADAHQVEWDLSDLESIDGHIAGIERELGAIDILINITGGPPPTPVGGQDPAIWRSQFESMVMSVIELTDRVLPNMKEKGWGRVITSTSSGVLSPIPNLGLSNSLRSALLGWNKTLSNEVAGDGITCNIVVPGRIATQRVAQLDSAKAGRDGTTVEEVRRASEASIPIGRYGRPEEYADVVTFLSSERASYVTGTVVRVEGGLVAAI